MIDEQIRELIGHGLSPELPPLTAEELGRRGRNLARRPDHRWLLAAACVVCLVVLAGGLAMLRADSTPTVTSTPTSGPPSPPDGEASGPRVGRYFVPSSLPDGFVLLGIEERPSLPVGESSGRALYTDDAGARVALRTVSTDGRWSTSDNTAELDAGVVRWSRFELRRTEPVIMFQIDRGSLLIEGEAFGVEDTALPELFNAISITPAGVPSVDDAGYTLTAAAEPGSPRLIAEYAAFYGPPGGYFGMAGIEIRIEKYAEPVDPDLEAGVWNDSTTINDRTIMLGIFDSLPRWMPANDTIVRIQVSGDVGSFTAPEILASTVEADDAAITDAIDRIAATAEALDITETLTFNDGSTVDLYGPTGDARGLCLTVATRRRCDLATVVRSGYTSDEQLAITQLELLVDQNWYTVGLTQDPTTLDPSARTAEGTSGTWYLIQHPDDATSFHIGDGPETPRPSR